MNFRSWCLAARPKTLTASFVPVMVASSLVVATSSSSWTWRNGWISALCLMCALSIQIATNFFNDVIDFKKGADSSERVGPTRVTQSGLMTEAQVWRAAFVFIFIAILTGIPLVLYGGWPILTVGVVSLFLAYGYTGGPFPLAYLGLGDLFVLLFFGLIAVCGVYFLHTQTLTDHAWLAGFQVGCHATVLIAINNLRDREQDQKVRKKTSAVRLGEKFARYEISVLVLLPLFINILWSSVSLLATLLPWLTLPLALSIIKKAMTLKPSQEMNSLLAQSALLHFTFAFLLSLGFLLS